MALLQENSADIKIFQQIFTYTLLNDIAGESNLYSSQLPAPISFRMHDISLYQCFSTSGREAVSGGLCNYLRAISILVDTNRIFLKKVMDYKSQRYTISSVEIQSLKTSSLFYRTY